MEWRRRRRPWRSTAAILCWVSLSLLSLCVLISELHGRDILEIRSSRTDSYHQAATKRWRRLAARQEQPVETEENGPGSFPPLCAAKCGSCSPCSPIHVPVPPGKQAPRIAEYYPEAWRCKCGRKLYNP